MHVLFVARWYPSYDAPARGTFVSDQVAGLVKAGIRVTVASWGSALVRGTERERADREAVASSTWERAVREPMAVNHPGRWNDARVGVARLPMLDDVAHRAARDQVARHARLLLPFGRGLAARQAIDLVHAHTGIPDGVAAASLANELGLPLVTTEHSSTMGELLEQDPYARAAYRTLSGPGRRILAVSRSLADRIASAAEMPVDQFTVVPNAVPVDQFPFAGPDERDPDQLLWVGARTEQKGLPLLLHAFARLHRERQSLRLRLIGAAPTPDVDRRWAELGESLGISHALSFEPVASRATVAAAMARAAIFVHPSAAETFGMVAAEALATGLPVAAVDSGGVTEIVGRTGAFGEVAANADPVDLANAIQVLLSRRSTLDLAAMRRHVVSSYAPDVVAARLIDIYAELIGDRRHDVESDQSLPPDPDRRFVIIGLNRTMLDRRLAPFPIERLTNPLILTTASPAALDATTAAVRTRTIAGLAELDPQRTYRAEVARNRAPALAWIPSVIRPLAALLIGPRRWLARRRLVAQRRASARQDLRDAVLTACRGRPDATTIVACDAEDLDAAGAAFAAGAALAPGGLRWLADWLDQRGQGPQHIRAGLSSEAAPSSTSREH